MEVGIRQAKSELSKLISAALKGEKVYLLKHGEAVAQIVPMRAKKQLGAPLRGHGMFKDQLNLPPGWNSRKSRDRDTAELMAILNRDERD